MWSAEAVVVCALALLTRSAASLPPIHFVAIPPPDVSQQAEAYVRPGDPRIFLVTSSDVFRRAQRSMYRCGDLDAHRKLASVIIHEEWHVKNGADEVSAYVAQLMTLIRLGAGPGTPEYAAVSKAMRVVRKARDGRTAGLSWPAVARKSGGGTVAPLGAQ